MADQPGDDDWAWYDIVVEAKEYRSYRVPGNGQEEARLAFLKAPYDYHYDIIDIYDGVIVEITEVD